MVRTTIFLPEELHDGLKRLALERRRSMADLLREAVEQSYRRDLEDLRAARAAYAEHLRSPGRSVPAREHFAKRARGA
ncbi:MAG: ribbon-helix-helix protein, CopG family [Elusimicrobia bacterium]|nr:ribbon-helix-helix protein, CopG family [Elusimicrobiota bacterium]